MSDSPKTKTFILIMADGKQKKITIPDNWKVTFGSLVPGIRSNGGDGVHAAWRCYASKEDQRACFVGVREYRETSIKVEEKITKTKSQTVKAQTPEGMRDIVMKASVEEWRNPDDTHPVPEAFTTLPELEDFSFASEGEEA